MIDVKKVLIEARAEIAKENADKAKAALVKKLRELVLAEKVVSNIKRDIADLEQSIEDGSFTG